ELCSMGRGAPAPRFSGPIRAREGFVDEDYRRRFALIVARVERAPRDELDSERAEPARAHDARGGNGRLIGRRRGAIVELEAQRDLALGMRQRDTDGARLRAGQRLEPRQKAVIERADLVLLFVLGVGERETRGDEIVWIEPWIHLQKARKA